jgi:hypothetical protein
MGMAVNPYGRWTHRQSGEIEFQTGTAEEFPGTVDLDNYFQMSVELRCEVWCAACFWIRRISEGWIEGGCAHEGKWQEIAGPGAA